MTLVPAANIPVSIIGGEGMLEIAFVTTAAASGPRDMDLAFPINRGLFLCCLESVSSAMTAWFFKQGVSADCKSPRTMGDDCKSSRGVSAFLFY